MSIKVNMDDCIGCGVCSQLCPEAFGLDEDAGRCVVISQDVTPSVRDAVDSCPVSAISTD
ncbi:MAG: ferredoxin [Synergistes sp.]|nr:ferredoxin [Synergistes sp.]